MSNAACTSAVLFDTIEQRPSAYEWKRFEVARTAEALTQVVIVGGGTQAARAAALAGVGVDPHEPPTVPVAWVAGSATDLAAQVSGGAADRARVAIRINTDLVFKDTGRGIARYGAGAATT
jgi:hypothetical protein